MGLLKKVNYAIKFYFYLRSNKRYSPVFVRGHSKNSFSYEKKKTNEKRIVIVWT